MNGYRLVKKWLSENPNLRNWLIWEKAPESYTTQEKLVHWCQYEPDFFLFNFVWTLDEHDETNPLKLFPQHNYLMKLVEYWARERVIVILKSRQMLVTWLFVALFLHDALFKQGRRHIFFSKKEDDAAHLIERALIIYDNFPRWFKERFAIKRPKGEKPLWIIFPSQKSRIIALPQGEHQSRGFTASGVFIDEAAFQEYFEALYSSTIPIVHGGGRLVAVSSANPSFFERLWREEI